MALFLPFSDFSKVLFGRPDKGDNDRKIEKAEIFVLHQLIAEVARGIVPTGSERGLRTPGWCSQQQDQKRNTQEKFRQDFISCQLCSLLDIGHWKERTEKRLEIPA